MRLPIDFAEKATYTPEYLDLLKKFDVPSHGLTAEQIRFLHYSFRNEINVFFRKCDLTGELIMSQFPQSSPFKVFRHDLWWSQEFEVPEADYVPGESFFAQFHRLQLKVPRMSTACDSTIVNSPYVNCVNHCKDCHMIFASGSDEDCFYSLNLERSQSTMNASIAHECTLCHEITSCRTCYNLDFSAYCNECFDSRFLYDCRRCKNCFLCVGLVGKEYCILNKQYSKEDYEREIKKYEFLTHEAIDANYAKLEEMKRGYIHKYANLIGSENCTGNDISFSQNCLNSYIVEYSKDCINGTSLRQSKDCLDFDLWGDPGELCYNSMSCGYGAYYLRMCFDCWNNCRFLTYCDSCPGSEECFGCIGLKRRKYCILNKQYSKEAYGKKVDEIISDMKKSSEWGQFFPPFCSPYALNNSMANEYFEVDKKLADKLGYEWMDKSSEKKYDPRLLYSGSKMSEEVKYEDLKGKVLLCKKSGLPFNVQAKELELLQRKKLPLPNKHWRVRFEERDQHFIFPWKLALRKTVDTHKEVYSPVPEKYAIRELATE